MKRFSYKLKQTILSAAISGCLTSRDENDEPVRSLIERIEEYKEVNGIRQTFHRIKSDQLFSIPEEWEWSFVGDVCYNFSYGTAKKSLQEGAIAVLRMGNLIDGEIDYSDLVFSSDKEDIEKYTLHKGDLLFNRTNSREKVGKVAIYRGDRPAIYAGYLVRFTPLFVKSEYLNIVMQTDYYKNYCQSVKLDAIGQSNINAKKLMAFQFPLPPLEEQQRIIDCINKLIPKLDEYEKMEDQLVALKERFPEDMREAIIQAALKGHITRREIEDDKIEDLIDTLVIDESLTVNPDVPWTLPENWRWVSIGNLAKSLGTESFSDGPFGSNLKKEHQIDEHEVRIIQLSNIGDRGWKNDNEKYTSYAHLTTLPRCEVLPGDFVIAKMMPAGRTVQIPDLGTKIILGSDAMKFVPNPVLNKTYLLYALNSDMFFEQVKKDAHGITRVRTTLSKLKTYVIPLPSLAEQKRIVQKLDAILPLIDDLAESI